MNVLNVILGLQKMFNYNWKLSDGYPDKEVKYHGKKVFTTFACGGGSSMGYKLAGYNVIGANDIDPQMKKVYVENHHPNHYFLESIADLHKRTDLPDELFDIDILDGSPPCSTFSMAGSREKAWGKDKVFREGQAKQLLSDLFFEFIKLAEVLKPKVIIAENVKGMLAGNAKGYLIMIKQEIEKIGYDVQIFLLNAATMGVPQRRERVFILCRRKDLSLPKIEMVFNEKNIIFSEFSDRKGKEISGRILGLWGKRIITDKDFGTINLREIGKQNEFGRKFVFDNETPKTILAGDMNIPYSSPRYMSRHELCCSGSFPQDYNFMNLDDKYLIGMSVPPVMMAQVANQVYNQ